MASTRLNQTRQPHWPYIIFTVIIAAFLALLPLPEAIKYAWPDWATLVIFYWVLILPKHLGVMFAWLNGFLEDIMSYSLLGQHALGKAFIGAIAALGNHRLSLFNFIERMLIIFILQSIHIMIVTLINFSAFEAPIRGVYWEAALSTALVWPLVSFLISHFDPNAQ